MTWRTAPLGEITTILSGTTPDSSNPSYWNGTHVWVTPTDLGKLDEVVIATSSRLISEQGRESCNPPLIAQGAVIMSSRAPIGHLAIAGCDLHTNQGCKSFVCSSELDAEFLYFTLMHRMADIQALGSGATFVEVSKSALETFEISFPKSTELQRRIADRLKAQLAEVKTARQAAQAQLQDTAALKTKTLESLFSNIANWAPIGSAAKLQSGYAFKSDNFESSGVRLLRNANILPGKVYWDDGVFLSKHDSEKYPSYALSDGDVLISLDRPIISSGIKVARVGIDDLPALLVQRVGRFLIDAEKLDADYLYAYLQTDLFISKISGHDQSLGVPHISPSQVEAIEIPLPEITVQRELSKQLNEVTSIWQVAVAAMQSQVAELSKLPKAILAQAFAQ